jgi:hypothetical protein
VRKSRNARSTNGGNPRPSPSLATRARNVSKCSRTTWRSASDSGRRGRYVADAPDTSAWSATRVPRATGRTNRQSTRRRARALQNPRGSRRRCPADSATARPSHAPGHTESRGRPLTSRPARTATWVHACGRSCERAGTGGIHLNRAELHGVALRLQRDRARTEHHRPRSLGQRLRVGVAFVELRIGVAASRRWVIGRRRVDPVAVGSSPPRSV